MCNELQVKGCKFLVFIYGFLEGRILLLVVSTGRPEDRVTGRLLTSRGENRAGNKDRKFSKNLSKKTSG